MIEVTSGELDLPLHELYEMASTAARSAYAPYSHFRVGAAVRTNTGAVFLGCNVENASYGLTVCGERNAIFAAVTATGPDLAIREIAVYSPDGPASPCGACRQVIAEFGPDARVAFPAGTGIVIASIAELLPGRFSQSDLP